ncbi:hypothetical protein GPJ56_010251 [Histomonas meleagridis]|uniref:uncharacterized protein n=1 Tax=Histomonas meleagridis TaxID=135588 RepID=UPI00355A1EDC|nr:hypothetical protein GPJ56_010251 [Histomonas meleagridis]KAH0797119.1 hypothetical protein GO595_011012 [Histomonas meleagridis]
MIDSSLKIWPNSKGLAEELGIEIILQIRPLSEKQQQQHPDENPKQCANCGAYFTSVFLQTSNPQCPFCGTVVKTGISTDYLIDNFYIDKPLPETTKLFVGFVFDMDAIANTQERLKEYFSVALNSISQNERFFCAVIFPRYISFLRVINGSVKGINFSFSLPLKTISIDFSFLLNEAYDVPVILKHVQSLQSYSNQALHSIPNLSFLFNSDSSFFKVLMFSSNSQQQGDITANVSVDWITCTKSSSHDGLSINVLDSHISNNASLQVTTLVRSYFDSNVIFKLHTRIFIGNQLDVNPSNFHKVSVPNGYSRLIRVSMPRVSFNTNGVPIQVVSNFILFETQHTPHQMRTVTSKVFPTSHDYLPILGSLSPGILNLGIEGIREKSNLIPQLLRIYNNKILPIMAGKRDDDIFFSLIPPLQMLLKFSVSAAVPMQEEFIVDKGKDYLRYTTGVSFWASQNFLIEELALWPYEVNVALNKPPIVVADSFYEIKVYANENIDDESKLGKELRKRKLHRFPVPKVYVVNREKFELEWPKQENECKTIELMLRQ